MLGTSMAAAQTQSPGTAAPSATQAGQGRVLKVGEKVRVSWSGQWYNATILAVEGGRYQVHYDGWASTWDEWVDPSRIRLASGEAVAPPPTPAVKPAAAAAARPTEPAAKPPAPATKPSEPASWLPPGALDGPPSSTATPEPAVKIFSEFPVGRWECRTWDYGQVNRVGGFTLKSNGSYEDLFTKKAGKYTYDKSNSRIVFTSGPQKTNATVTFNAAGHSGKGHIVLNYGGGAKLDCYRE